MASKIYKFFFLLSFSISFSQTIKVNDTDFSKGRLGNIQKIKLNDVSKLHGHLCDGLVEGFIALEFGLKKLYPDGIIDRTNTRIVSKSSPCWADVAIYISGGRSQFNTFYVNNSINGMYLVQRIDNLKTILIKRKPNVKPTIIDELGNKAIRGELDACDLQKLKKLEVDYAKFLKKSKPENLFEVAEVPNFKWEPKSETYIKTDILNKNKLNCK